MKQWKLQKKEQVSVNKIAFAGGSYSLAITAVVLAILIVINILVSTLPATWTSFDISSTKLYSITSNTKVVVNALEKDVTIYWVVQSEKEDAVIENLLNKYESLSGHIEVVKKNPDVYPTFTAQYTEETVPNNSLIVACGDKYRYISYNDIYLTDFNMSTYSYDSSFDGEGAITSAIDYVVNEEQPQLYVLEGHGESALPDYVATQIEKENIETVSFSLLNTGEIPEEADAILIYAPTSDISTDEQAMLAEYVENGGKIMVLGGLTREGSLTNLYGLLEDYGVTAEEGIVIETDRQYYAFQEPYILLPDIEESTITTALIDENYYVIMPIAQGLNIGSTDNGEVTELLSTSETAFSKRAGYNLTTYEKEEEDADGPFTLAVSVANVNDGQIVWIASANFLDELYNSYSSGANLDLTMNAISSMLGENEAVAIRSKSLNYNYLTISESTSSFLRTLMIGVIPAGYLLYGIYVVVKRRAKNEAV